MHGQGHRCNCPTCGQEVRHLDDTLSHRELRGPRQITSSNIDRIFDDGGKRLLLIEEKNPDEGVKPGQGRLLYALAAIPEITVWGCRGTPQSLTVTEIPTRAVVTEGDWGDYQRAVLGWFASPAPEARGGWLEALTEAPFDAPSWCPPDLWNRFDALLAEVAKLRVANVEPPPEPM